jgi:hypothetical protein
MFLEVAVPNAAGRFRHFLRGFVSALSTGFFALELTPLVCR